MIFNIFAWLRRSPLRKCGHCGRISDKSTMVPDLNEWFCNQDHLREYLDYTSQW